MPSFFEALGELAGHLLALVLIVLIAACCITGAAMAIGLFVRMVRYFGGF